MSKEKRLEKEIDYLKTIIGILSALCAGLSTWFVNTDKNTNLLFQTISVILFFVFFYVIIKSHKKVNDLLSELEATHDE